VLAVAAAWLDKELAGNKMRRMGPREARDRYQKPGDCAGVAVERRVSCGSLA